MTNIQMTWQEGGRHTEGEKNGLKHRELRINDNRIWEPKQKTPGKTQDHDTQLESMSI